MSAIPVLPPATTSVRHLLTLLVAVCTLPMALVLALLIIHVYQQEEAQLIESTLNHARHISAAADREIRATQLALQTLAGSHLLHAASLRDFHARASKLVDQLHVDSIVLLDASGQLLLSTRRPYGSALAQLSDTPLTRRIVSTGQAGVSG
ncbi:MAG: PAS domain-containing sensor histidine kinase, partial [Burkholderiaceae bacterium]|nr:PAS domain-containing sensor histidine kinase [Burkholderiaceae bacterium]